MKTPPLRWVQACDAVQIGATRLSGVSDFPSERWAYAPRQPSRELYETAMTPPKTMAVPRMLRGPLVQIDEYANDVEE